MAVTLNASNSGTGGLSVTSDATGNLAFQTAGTTAVTVDTSQNVGIGTSSPSFTGGSNGVMISGLKPALRLSSTTTGSGTWEIYADSASLGGLGFYERQNNTTTMYLDEGGNVLVGANTVYSGTASNFTATTGVDIGSSSTATSKQLQFIRNGSTGTAGSIYATAGSFSNYCGMEFVIENVGGGSQAGYLKFNTTSSATSAERMRIASDGKVFVGTGADFTDNPQQGLILYAATNNSQLVVSHGNGTSSGTFFAKFDYNANTIGSISQNGTTAVAYNTSSDYRLKENIAPLTGALNKVSQLKPVTYTWKASPEETGEGFIAHELAEICPQAVHGTKDEVDANGNPKYQGVDTSFLVATLTAAIQELKALNDTQSATITALTARIVALEGR